MKAKKLFLALSLILLVSCGKEKKDSNTLVIEKGTGRLLLNDAETILEFRQKYDTASDAEQILMGNPPQENYRLMIDDIEQGDYVDFVEADVSSWLSTKQKQIVKSNNGCVKVTFFGSTFFPENGSREAFFAPGDIAFESSLSCD